MKNSLFNNIEILIVEDNPINYYLIQTITTIIGAKPIWAKNGLEAIDILDKEKNISIILMDIQMPVMDGITATKEIRQKEINTPIIFQTSCANEENKEKCFAVGGNEFLGKPLNQEKLCFVLEKYLA